MAIEMIIERLRVELKDLNEKILNAKSVTNPNTDVLRNFVINQLYIVPNDLSALSIAMSRARDSLERRFVKYLIDGDYNALESLYRLAEELKIEFSWDRVNPAAVAYTHFLSWLALNGSTGDLAVALIINLPVWGANCLRLAEWAKSAGVKNTQFLELFAGPYEELERLAEEIALRYLDWSRYRFIARAIQYYEYMFWDSIV
ncbi:MAG: TenA family transcriptional regulator [Sulfolobales archaeon]